MRAPAERSSLATAASVLLALLLGACGTQAAGPGPGPDPGGGTPTPPEVGDCRPVLSAAARGAPFDGQPAVPCEGPHGGEVVAVPTVAEELADEPVGEALEELAAGCPDATEAVTAVPVGSELVSAASQPSFFSVSYFYPTVEEQLAGARWVRCEVTAVGFDGGGLAYEGRLADLGHGSLLPAGLALCAGPTPTADGWAKRVPCRPGLDRLVVDAALVDGVEPAEAEVFCTDALTSLGVEGEPLGALSVGLPELDGQPYAIECLVPFDLLSG